MILLNPTLAEVEDLLTQSAVYICALENINGDIYVWPAEMGSFEEIVQHLALNEAKAINRGPMPTLEAVRESGLFT